MIVVKPTGEYDDQRIYTAAELAGEWWWTDDYHAQIVGGRSLYETVAWPERESATVRLWRLDTSGRPRSIYRYVDPETSMKLVLVKER